MADHKQALIQLNPLNLGENFSGLMDVLGSHNDDIETDISTLSTVTLANETTLAFIDRHEKMWGISPDSSDSLQTRIDNVLTQIRMKGAMNVLHYVDIAANKGIIVSIDENVGFILGFSKLGVDPVGGEEQRFTWKAILSEQHRFPFILGSTPLGSPLVSFDVRNSVESIYERTKPAHTTIQFEYFDWGFESGVFEAWRQREDVIDSTTVRTGTFSAKLIASGSDIVGVESTPFQIPTDKGFTINSWHNVTAYSAGTYSFVVDYYSDLRGLNFVSSDTIFSKTSTTSGWEQGIKTVGPSRLVPDFIFPATAKSFRIKRQWTSTPTGTAFIDDIDLSYM